MRIPLAEVAGVLSASVVGNMESGLVAQDVSYDSRQVAPGNLFVAIIAQRDGHDFVLDAVQAGAAAVLVSREVLECPVPQLVVADTSVALTALGKWAREHVKSTVKNRVVGITGSVGKTSTKDFIAAVMATQFVVGASEKSLNNDQGVPVTLLNAPEPTEALVVEMGMRGFDLTIWHGLYAPKGTPPAVLAQLNEALKKALKDPEFIKKQEGLGAIVVNDKRVEPANHKAFVAGEIAKLKPVIEAAGKFAD